MYGGIILALVLNTYASALNSVDTALSSMLTDNLPGDEVANPTLRPHLIFSSPVKAHAWLNDMSHRLDKWLSDDYLKTGYLTIIQYEAKRAGLDPQLVLSLITVESNFNNFAISPMGARGLMQVMPAWLEQIGNSQHNLFNVQTNIRYGCTILRYFLQKEYGNLERALERYNGSLGSNWYPALVMQAYHTYWEPYPVVTIKSGQVVQIDYTS